MAKDQDLKRKWGVDEPSESGATSSGEREIEKLLELIARAEPMIEQLNNLYAQYLAGIERLPPNVRRKQLDDLMAQIQIMQKPSASYRFKADTLHTRYVTFRDRWDKQIRDLESGRIKRRGPA